MSDTLAPPDRTRHKAILLLILAGLCTYSNSLNKAFVLDDAWWITNDENPADVAKYLTNDLTLGRPIIALSLIANAVVHNALAANSVDGGHYSLGYRVVNIVVHLLATLALFGIVRRTLLLPRWPQLYRDAAIWLAFAVALLWMLHPIQVQSVTYVIQRCESMMGLFFLFGFYCALRSWDAAGWWWWQLAALVSFALGAGCKEVIAGAALLVVLYDWAIRGERFGALVRRLPFYVGLALATLGVLLLMRYLHHLRNDGQATFGGAGSDRLGYLRTQPGVLLYYVKICFWPPDMCFDWSGNPYAEKLSEWLPQSIVVGFFLLLSGVGVLLRRWWGFAGAWFFLILAPTSSIIVITDTAFDHRMYLPYATIVLLVVILGYGLLNRLTATALVRDRLAGAGLVLLGGTLTVLTILRNEDYRSAEVLYTDTVLKNPQCARELYNLALEESDKDDLTPAIGHCERALAWHAKYGNEDVSSHSLRGRLAFHQGDFKVALQHFERAFQKVENHRDSAMSLQAQCYRFQGDQKKAIATIRHSIAKGPAEPTYHLELAVLLDEDGQREAAQTALAEALRLANEKERKLLDETNVKARRNAVAYPRKDRAFAYLAVFQAKQAVLGDPNNAEYLDTLAIALASDGKFSEGVATATRARKLALANGEVELAKAIRKRIKLFEERTPYRLDTVRGGRVSAKRG